jgi:hypothetical protein
VANTPVAVFGNKDQVQADLVIELVEHIGGEGILVVEMDQILRGEFLFGVAMEGGEDLVQFASIDRHWVFLLCGRLRTKDRSNSVAIP